MQFAYENAYKNYIQLKQSNVVSGSAYRYMFSFAQPVYVFWLTHLSIYRAQSFLRPFLNGILLTNFV